MEVSLLLGKQECNEASDVDLQLLRLLTPITKLYTAKQVSGQTLANMICSITFHPLEPQGIVTVVHRYFYNFPFPKNGLSYTFF